MYLFCLACPRALSFSCAASLRQKENERTRGLASLFLNCYWLDILSNENLIGVVLFVKKGSALLVFKNIAMEHLDVDMPPHDMFCGK